MSRRRPESALPTNKVCDLAGDAAQLAPYYEAIDRFPDVMASQHAIRKWEYGMALRTLDIWVKGPGEHPPYTGGPLEICDVGGGGTGFCQLLATLTPEPVVVIDHGLRPASCDGILFAPTSVEAFAATGRHDQFDVITSISVIEHVAQVRPFLRAIRMLLKPGGLLVLTADYWDCEGPDTAHYHWMRQRIYNPDRVTRLLQDGRELGFQIFGTSDWAYPGPQIYGYSVCCVAMTRKGSASA